MYLLFACQLGLSCLLLLSGISKLLSPQGFLAALQANPISRRFVSLLAIIILISELELALGLLFDDSWSLPISFLGAFLLLSIFTIWLARVYKQKLDIQCGCFGNSPSSIKRSDIIRNLIIMGISSLGFFLALSFPSPLPHFTLEIPFIGFLLASGVALRLITYQMNQQKYLRKEQV